MRRVHVPGGQIRENADWMSETAYRKMRGKNVAGQHCKFLKWLLEGITPMANWKRRTFFSQNLPNKVILEISKY